MPSSKIKEVLKESHSGTGGGHLGVKKTEKTEAKILLGQMPSSSEGVHNKLYPVYCRQRSYKRRSRTAATVRLGRIFEEDSDGQQYDESQA